MAPSNISPGSAATVLSFLALAGLQLETRFRVGEVLAAPRPEVSDVEHGARPEHPLSVATSDAKALKRVGIRGELGREHLADAEARLQLEAGEDHEGEDGGGGAGADVAGRHVLSVCPGYSTLD